MQLVYKLKITSSSKDETYKWWLQVQFSLFTSWEVWGKEFLIWDGSSMMALGVLRPLFSKSLAILSMGFFPHSGICHVKSINFYIRRKKRRKLQRKMLLFYSILRSLLRNVRHWHLQLASHCSEARDVEQNIRFCIHAFAGFLGGSSGKEFSCRCWRCGFDPRVGKMHWSRKWQCVSVFLHGKSCGPEEPEGLQSMGWQTQMHEHVCAFALCYH